MLEFKEVRLGDRAVLEPILRALPYRVCDHSFASLYIWDKSYPASFCVRGGALFIKYGLPSGEVVYQMPFGGDLAESVELLRRDARETVGRLKFISLNADMRREIEDALPGRFVFTEQRNFSDYIYNAADLIHLTGKKFHGKRNYINRFNADFLGRYSLEDVGPSNADEILKFNRDWDEEYGHDDDIMREAEAIERAVRDLDAVGMCGVALRLDGLIIAYALGTQLNDDTFLEQIEKANAVPGSYQMITNGFARRFCEGYRYINREEDMGIEGLRRSKMSYNPAFLNTRYSAEETSV